MTDGILMVVFGEQYDTLAAHTVAYSRQFTDIPIVILSNVAQRDVKWDSITNVSFIDIDRPQNENRQIKTTMVDYTPFDRTLYLDCDVIIQKQGVESLFDLITPDHLSLKVYRRHVTADTLKVSYYRSAFKHSNIQVPITVYYGAIIGFMKCESVQSFFKIWNEQWIMNGRGREMAPLACATHLSQIDTTEFPSNSFSWALRKSVLIQHEYGSYVRKLVGCPDFKAYKPFDKISRKGK